MIVHYSKSFLRDYRKIQKSKALLDKIEAVALQFQSAKSLQDIPGIKNLKLSYYRVRLGDYRLGFRLADDEVIFECILHRREIYRYYPPK